MTMTTSNQRKRKYQKERKTNEKERDGGGIRTTGKRRKNENIYLPILFSTIDGDTNRCLLIIFIPYVEMRSHSKSAKFARRILRGFSMTGYSHRRGCSIIEISLYHDIYVCPSLFFFSLIESFLSQFVFGVG
jgi:hypothetical protein